MIRILLWKLCFEWAHLERIIRPRDEEKILYFAFGANLSQEVLLRRRIRVYQSFDHVLQGARLNFSQIGFYKDHGYASADQTEDSVVYGKMYLILKSDARRMDYFEGVPFLDVHERVISQFEGSAFFYYRSLAPQQDLKPTQEYLDYLTNGYNAMSDVPRDYIQSLSATDVLGQFLPQDQTGQFVRNIDAWPTFMHSLLRFYESSCLQTVEFFWNRSLIQWMIRIT